MLGTTNRKIKILGAGWLVLGGLAFARAFFAIAQFPSASGDWVATLVVSLVLGSIHMVSGWALLRRNSLARRLLAQIHRRDDYAAAERAIGAREGDGPGTIWGRGGPVRGLKTDTGPPLPQPQAISPVAPSPTPFRCPHALHRWIRAYLVASEVVA